MDWPPGALPFDPPFTLGHENAGYVHAVGAGVDTVQVGQAVAVFGPWGCGKCAACGRACVRQGAEAARRETAGGGGSR